jgi:hypothetical protein
MKTEDGRGNYFSNYNQHNYISQMELDNYYYTSLEECYEAWIDSIEKFKEKVIKQFENKCKVDYTEYRISKLKEILEYDPDIVKQIKKLRNEVDKSK